MNSKTIILEYCPYDKENLIDRDYVNSKLKTLDTIENISTKCDDEYIEINIKDEEPIQLNDYAVFFEKVFNLFKINSFQTEYNIYTLHSVDDLKNYFNVNKITNNHRFYSTTEIIQIDDNKTITITKGIRKGVIMLDESSVYRFRVQVCYLHNQNGKYIQFGDIKEIDEISDKAIDNILTVWYNEL